MKSLNVLLATDPNNPIPLGQLFIEHRQIYFEYASEWLQEGFSITPYALPLQAGLVKDSSGLWQGLHGVFNDSLPDGWGLLLMDRELRKAGINPREITPLDRLAWLGNRTMGALIYEPTSGPDSDPLLIDIQGIAENARQLFSGTGEIVLPELFRAGGSPGGARPKALIAIKDETIITADGSIPSGFTPWLVKFNAEDDFEDSGRVEYAYSKMAMAAGLNMPETQLLETEFFAVRRFDRLKDKRVHVHTLGNMVASDFRVPSLDYADLFKVVMDVTKSRSELLKAFRQMVFNIAVHNRDDHSKNFAFIWHESSQRWRFSPSYDLMYSPGVYGEHTMTVSGEGKKPSLGHVMALAAAHNIRDEAQQIVSEINTVVSNATNYLTEAGVSDKSMQQLKNLITPLQ